MSLSFELHTAICVAESHSVCVCVCVCARGSLAAPTADGEWLLRVLRVAVDESYIECDRF